MKKLFLILILFISWLLLWQSGSSHASEITAYGICGDSAEWEINNGVLRIFGSGEVDPFEYEIEPPWYDYRDEIKQVWIEEGITNIPAYAFCTYSQLEQVTISDSVTSIGQLAFYGCTGLTEITIPDHVTEIGMSAFWGCSALASVHLPEELSEIEYGTFSWCSSLMEIEIPENVTSIGGSSFSVCTSLVRIQFPDGLQIIGPDAFHGCSSLHSITIPQGVTSIGYDEMEGITRNAFWGCSGLSEITVQEGNRYYDSRDNCNAIIETATNTLLTGCAETYVPEGVTGIGREAFLNCESLTQIVLPEGIIEISDSAFCGCRYLKEIELPDSLTIIQFEAFAGCISLEELIIPESVEYIGDYAFSYCSSLRAVTIPENITNIGWAVFNGCSSLSSVTLSEQLSVISESAFRDCCSLKAIRIPATVETIEYQAFSGCTSLTDVYYAGTRERWESLSQNADLGEINLYATEDYDADLVVTIRDEEVPGGIVVTMDAARGSIYYTVDNSMPGTHAIPYEGPFLLDEAGIYEVRAIVIDSNAGTVGNPVTYEPILLEQSELPQIYTEYGSIHIMPGENVYYSLDLTESPSLTGKRYQEPIWLSETTVIKARTIESGKAPSEIVSYVFSMEENTIHYPADSYAFRNVAASFGYPSLGYKISKTKYTEIFGEAAGEFLYQIYGGGSWAGSCFGMSATSLMFNGRLLDLGSYSLSASSLYEIGAPGSRESILTQLIERYQVSQFLPVMVLERNDSSSGGNMVISGLDDVAAGMRLLSAVQKSCSGEEPIILIVWRTDLMGSHAVVPYKLEDGKIYVYDCNKPGQENVITYTRNGNSYRFHYGEYSYAISYNTLSTLLENLEGLRTGHVSLTANGKELILFSINTGNYEVWDRAGNAASDYAVCLTTEDAQAPETVLYMEQGDHVLMNTGTISDLLRVSASTEEDYYSVTVSDPAARIGVGMEFGHLYLTVCSDLETRIVVHVRNTSGRENDIEIESDYAKIYACTELVTLIDTKTPVITANGIEQQLDVSPNDPDVFTGAVTKLYSETASGNYQQVAGWSMSTDIQSLSEITVPEGSLFTLIVHVNASEEIGDVSASLYAASYNAAGQMTDLSQASFTEGKANYPFSIKKGTAFVRIFIVDNVTGKPLTQSLTVR